MNYSGFESILAKLVYFSGYSFGDNSGFNPASRIVIFFAFSNSYNFYNVTYKFYILLLTVLI